MDDGGEKPPLLLLLDSVELDDAVVDADDGVELDMVVEEHERRLAGRRATSV